MKSRILYTSEDRLTIESAELLFISSARAISWGGGGGCNPKKPKKTEKNRKKPVPNLKFAVAFGFFGFFGFFRFFFGFFGIFRFFSVFCGTFSVFFGLNFDKKFQSFKNHVNNEDLGGQELPNNILNAYKALQMAYKCYY